MAIDKLPGAVFVVSVCAEGWRRRKLRLPAGSGCVLCAGGVACAVFTVGVARRRRW
ncbi:hypothetical protein [Rhodococcus erythropolis]|uniref:hypothetical protein n=1 Tax=Rhodococcus erythropolis TaxID=1833 RepID=UPI0012D3DD03|nr:hypothetical protein [Rhodococcus erythropolis]